MDDFHSQDNFAGDTTVTLHLTPGHTKGHLCLLFQNRFLFTGDHLAWDRHNRELEAFRDYCWHSWSLQKTSMSRLLEHDFEWILPGHGTPWNEGAVEAVRRIKAAAQAG